VFLTRGLDLFLLSYTARAGLPWGERAAGALGALRQWGPWLEVSWFLIVPLAVNGLYLCPMLLRRCLRARRHGGWQGAAALPAFVVASGALLFAGTAIYLAVVAGSHLG
jgi:hypothetical protein